MEKRTVGNALAPVGQAAGGVLRRLLDAALDGVGGVPGVRQTAGGALTKHQDHEAAIASIVRHHVVLAGAQGFVTSLGGFALLPVALPANVSGVAVVQLRMVGSIAHLRGYDIDDPRVRSAVMACLLGPGSLTGGDAEVPHPLLVATAPVFDRGLDQRISERVLAELLASIGGRKAATLLIRRIPVLGGGVGLAVDSYSTQQVARYAVDELRSRRRTTHHA